MTNSRWLVGGVLISVATLGGIAGALRLANAVPGRSAGASAPDFAEEGESFRLALSAEMGLGGKRSQRVSVDGVWQSVKGLHTPGTPAGNATRLYRLLDPRISGDLTGGAGAGDPGLEALRAALARPFHVSYVSSRPERAYFAADLPDIARNLLLTVVAELPESAPPTRAQVTTERDLVGEHLAAVRPLAAGEFEKRKLSYRKVGGLTGGDAEIAEPLATITKSAWRLAFDGHGRLARLRGEDRVQIDLGLEGAKIQLATALTLEAPTAFDARALTSLAAETHASRVGVPIATAQGDPAARRRKADQALVAGAKLEALLAAFAEPRTQPSNAEYRAAVDRLAAAVRLAPESAGELVRRARASSGDWPGLVQALGRADIEPTRAALAEISSDAALAGELRVSAMRALGGSKAPDAPTMRALEPLLGDGDAKLREAAALAFGALLSVAHNGAATVAAAGTQTLVDRYRGAATDAERIDLLRAMGNARDSQLLPAIDSAIGSPQPAVRAAAANALRMIQAPGVDKTLDDLMAGDDNSRVRGAAIFSVSFRDPVPHAATLSERALHDADALVRDAAVALLGSTLDKVPGVAETLATVAKKDPKREIRDRARKLLQKS